MAFKITYKRIFEVEFLHDFYLNKGSIEFVNLSTAEQTTQLASNAIMKDLEILVPEDTRQKMLGLKLIMKPTDTGFFVAAEVVDNGFGGYEPKIAIGASLSLRFALRFKNPYFANFTNLSAQFAQQNILYLDNRLTPAGADPAIAACADYKGPFPYLSLKPLPRSNTQSYQPGEMVSSSLAVLEGANTYQADLLVDGNQQYPTEPKTPVWQAMQGQGYVNSRDWVQLSPKVFSYTFQQGPVSEASFTLLSWEGGPEKVAEFALPTGQTQSTFSLDFSPFPSGRYILRAEGKDATGKLWQEDSCRYLDDSFPSQRVQGVIEIFHKASESIHAYSLQKTEKKMVEGAEKEVHTLLNPLYQVHFKNRETYWRYIFNKELSPTTKLGELVKENGDTEAYTTVGPRPLTQQFSKVDFNGGFLLPNPGPEQIKVEKEKYFSDIYVYI